MLHVGILTKRFIDIPVVDAVSFFRPARPHFFVARSYGFAFNSA
jgi:hypothetical protein